jgi:hypothetical protein
MDHHRSPCRDLAIPFNHIEGFQVVAQTVAGVLDFAFGDCPIPGRRDRESEAFAFVDKAGRE